MDSFKEINDRYGHLVGDEILRHIGHLLQSSIRSEDQAFRWGGDEFLVVLVGLAESQARERLDELDRCLGRTQLPGVSQLVSVDLEDAVKIREAVA